jgi:hypothetical protein
MVHIVQCLCPQRHCITAAAYDDADGKPPGTALEALQALNAMAIRDGVINPWCGICGSRAWHYEDGLTSFVTLDEARPALARAMADQLATRQFLRSGRN